MLTNANSNSKVLPNDQKIDIKGDNPQLLLIIPFEILEVVHQDILNIFVNVTKNLRHWFDHGIKHKPYFCCTMNLVKYFQVSRSDTSDLSHVTEFYCWLQKSIGFSPFSFSNCYLTGYFFFLGFVLLLTLPIFSSFFPSFYPCTDQIGNHIRPPKQCDILKRN